MGFVVYHLLLYVTTCYFFLFFLSWWLLKQIPSTFFPFLSPLYHYIFTCNFFHDSYNFTYLYVHIRIVIRHYSKVILILFRCLHPQLFIVSCSYLLEKNEQMAGKCSGCNCLLRCYLPSFFYIVVIVIWKFMIFLRWMYFVSGIAVFIIWV